MDERLRVTNTLVEHNCSVLNDSFPKNSPFPIPQNLQKWAFGDTINLKTWDKGIILDFLGQP